MFSKLFEPLAVKIFGSLSLLLVALLTVQTLRLHHAQHAAASYKLAAETLKASYQAAQTAAHAKAVAAKIETENQYAQIARQADAEREESDRLRSAAADYARTHRVRCATIEGCGGRPASSSPGDAPPSDNGPAGPSDYIAISPADYARYNAIVDRMIKVHSWGQDLIDRKLAIPAPGFGQ